MCTVRSFDVKRNPRSFLWRLKLELVLLFNEFRKLFSSLVLHILKLMICWLMSSDKFLLAFSFAYSEMVLLFNEF